MSGRVPDKFPDLSFLVLEIKRNINMVRNITLKQFGVVDLHLRIQEHPPVLGRVPDMCPYLHFYF